MLDIFNVDSYFQKSIGFLNEIINNDFLKVFLLSLFSPLSMKNMRFYVNSSVISTHGFHIYSYVNQIYLTHVLGSQKGPYTYVKGIHLDLPYRRVN